MIVWTFVACLYFHRYRCSPKDLLVHGDSMQHTANDLQEPCHCSHHEGSWLTGTDVLHCLAQVWRTVPLRQLRLHSSTLTYNLGNPAQSERSCAAADMLLSLPVMDRLCAPELQSCLWVNPLLKTSVSPCPFSPEEAGVHSVHSAEPMQPSLVLLTS